MFINAISDFFENGTLKDVIKDCCDNKKVIPEEVRICPLCKMYCWYQVTAKKPPKKPTNRPLSEN